MKKTFVFKNIYRDSFELMDLSNRIRAMKGLSDVALFMGTAGNKERLEKLGFSKDTLSKASSNDICVGIEYESMSAFENAKSAIEDFLEGGRLEENKGTSLRFKPRSIEKAKDFLPTANIVSISLPGEYVVDEAQKSLGLDMNIFLFSDNVPIEDEIKLKEIAIKKNLLVMGPDCGTAMIRGTPLGFCNMVRRGPVGIVAASGTGAQEIMCSLDHQSIGISHVIGAGGRDLHVRIRGSISKLGLNLLNLDSDTKVIIFVSKPADELIQKEIVSIAKNLDKPIVCCFIGANEDIFYEGEKVYCTGSLNYAANVAAALIRGEPIPQKLTFSKFKDQNKKLISVFRASINPSQQYLRGLYSGGTLAYETAIVLSGILPDVRSGNGFGLVLPLDDWEKSKGNAIIDLGDDRFTIGRPHPMIDASYRIDRIMQEARDPEVGVLIIDIVMGTNTLEDPASVYVPPIKEAIVAAKSEGRNLAVIIHICASEDDEKNNLKTQEQQFSDAGCLVFKTNEETAFMAAAILSNSSVN